jgi:LPXTG-motif cell wall-anchored protein
VSRGGAERTEPAGKAGTPIWVWVVYGLGVLAGVIFAFSVLFTAGAHFLGGSGYRASPPAFVLWGGLLLIALATWFVRRRR